MQLCYITEEREEFKGIRTRIRRAAKTPVPEKLIEQIRSAFANTITPEADSLVSCPCPEHQSVKRRFQGKHWTEITDPRNFHMLDVSLALLNAAAFRFYLPAFLLGDLLNLGAEETRSFIGYSFYLTPPPNKEADVERESAQNGETKLEYFLNRVSGFSPEQKAVLKAYLQFAYRRRPATEQIEEVEHQRALDFWETFEG